MQKETQQQTKMHFYPSVSLIQTSTLFLFEFQKNFIRNDRLRDVTLQLNRLETKHKPPQFQALCQL